MKHVIKVTPALKAKFLEVYRKVRSVAVACRGLEIHPKTIYEYLKPDSEYFDEKFYEEYELLKEEIKEEVLSSALEKAMDGWIEPVFYQGEQTDEIRKKSDYLHGILLKGYHSDIMAERKELTGANGGAVRFNNVTKNSLDRKLIGIAARLGMDTSDYVDENEEVETPPVKKSVFKKKVSKKKVVKKRVVKKKVSKKKVVKKRVIKKKVSKKKVVKKRVVKKKVRRKT